MYCAALFDRAKPCFDSYRLFIDEIDRVSVIKDGVSVSIDFCNPKLRMDGDRVDIACGQNDLTFGCIDFTGICNTAALDVSHFNNDFTIGFSKIDAFTCCHDDDAAFRK